MTTTNLTNSKAAQKAGLKIKRNLVLVFIIICLTGGSALYANSDQRKVDRDKSKLDRKEMKMQKKERKMNRLQRKADQR